MECFDFYSPISPNIYEKRELWQKLSFAAEIVDATFNYLKLKELFKIGVGSLGT